MSVPSPPAVLEVIELHPPGTPVTTSEVAEEFDCPQPAIQNQLNSLVDDGTLQMKRVGGNSQVWWRLVEPEQESSEVLPIERTSVRARSLLNSSMIGVIVWGEDLKIKDANDTFLEMAGLDYEEALGTPWQELTPEEFYAASERHISEVEGGGSGSPYEKQYFHADGSRWWGIFETQQLNDSEKIELVVEITERKKHEQGLTQANKQLREFKQAADAAGAAIYILDPDREIKYTNDAFEDITGYSSAEAVGQHPHILKSGKMSDGYHEELFETVTSGEIAKHEVINRQKNGETYHARESIAPVTSQKGGIEAFVAVQIDITEQKELKKRLSLHRDIVERLDDPIMIQTVDGEFRLVNDALCSFAGLSKEQLLNDDEYEFMDSKTATKIARQKQRVIETEQPIEYSVEPTFEYSDREAVFYTSRYPYYEDGELVGTLAICRNATDLEDRTRQLEVLDNILRHNIRNNLNVIHGRGEQIKSGVDGDLQNAADFITEQAEDLLKTSKKSREITDVLTESVASEPIDIEKPVRSFANQITAEYPEANIDVKGSLKVGVIGVPSLDSAFEELVTNAVIHNDSDEPRLHVELSASEKYATLILQDNGPGIPSFDKNVLETGGAINKLSHGSGLGLWLVYWAIKRSGGNISVEYESEGTKITVRLLLAADG